MAGLMHGDLGRMLTWRGTHAGCRNRPLRGVLFWRWDLQVYQGMAPADYGVQVTSSLCSIPLSCGSVYIPDK